MGAIRAMLRPRKIVPEYNAKISALLDGIMLRNGIQHTRGSLQIYVTRTRHGQAWFNCKWITVPLWAMSKDAEYIDWYISHELAHIIQFARGDFKAGHGPAFQATLKSLTPYAYHELGYKPRMATAAGISKPVDMA